MTADTAEPVEDRLRQVLRHLGIERAHLAGRLAHDWAGLATRHPEMVASLTLLNSFEPRHVERLAARVLVVTGDRGGLVETVRGTLAGLPGARHVCLSDYDLLGWSDVAAERTDELSAAMLQFLAGTASPPAPAVIAPGERDGEVAGVTYSVRGAGPPLVLLPLFLSPSQWEPVLTQLGEHYCTITLGGGALGAVAILESRGRAPGYLQMVRSLIDAVKLQPGKGVVEIGCGTGVLCRWLARRTPRPQPIIGVDINAFLLREAGVLARQEGLAGAVEFRPGNAEMLPFPDNSIDLAMSVTVIEETDADRMLAEMTRITKPNGRVAVIARAMDMPFLMNLPLSPALKAKVEAPGAIGGVAPSGCADASLYRRMRGAGLTGVAMLPQLASFGPTDPSMLEFMEGGLRQRLDAVEVQEWRRARAEGAAEGTFFMAWPHHCAVGTKPG